MYEDEELGLSELFINHTLLRLDLHGDLECPLRVSA